MWRGGHDPIPVWDMAYIKPAYRRRPALKAGLLSLEMVKGHTGMSVLLCLDGNHDFLLVTNYAKSHRAGGAGQQRLGHGTRK